jgi:hypothetical protein
MKTTLTYVILIALLTGCSNVKETTKEVINKSGEVVGKGASEFFEGVSEGIDRTLDCELIVSQSLKDKGIETGKFAIGNDSVGGRNNVVTLYLIFKKDFDGGITARTVDKNGLEFGRKKLEISGKAGDAQYFDFTFDKRTYIEVRSKIYLE